MEEAQPSDATPAAQPPVPPPADQPAPSPPPPVAMGDCPSCGQPMPTSGTAPTTSRSALAYAVGRLTPQLPSLHVEKEFAHLTATVPGPEVSEQHRLKQTLAEPENLYLARHVCWMFTTQHIETFVIVPRDGDDLRQLVDAFAPTSVSDVVNVAVGGPAMAPVPRACVATGLPLIAADQLLSFTVDEFLDALPAPENGDAADDVARGAMRDLFIRITQRAGNRGLADHDRALNYLAVRYPAIYHTTASAVRDGKALLGVDSHPTPGGDRRLVSVHLSFRDRRTQLVERFACVVDATDEFCFLVRPLSPSYD
jgi:hypothetical protein